MPALALYTFGILKSPLTDPTPLMREFHDGAEAVYRTISHHPGYLAHAEAADGPRGSHFDLDWGAWGRFTVPAWYDRGRTPETLALAATLSLWTDPRSAFDALYTGLHRAAMNRRYDWFERAAHPGYMLWWAPDGATPTWQDGVARLERLHGHGATAHAFTFRRPFAPDGTPTTVDGTGPRGDRAR
ncbi:DUF3291 domain-containing protein [Streptomyces catenulae]|uniref:DUF3291 domain-containing protein n=1 Tax=Streptomyces catenulae TaxID=66875 RepID=A0ABV2Z4B5_9ACTN|nr:DUF3291 domain-containing protein [Streptomyces catenulae]